MAWPSPGDPAQTRCTGTTGIVKTHFDCILWDERVRNEDAVNARIHNPDGFAMRNALRYPAFPAPPHTTVPVPGEGLSVEALGWDPKGRRAKELHRCMANMKSHPRSRADYPETFNQTHGWMVTKVPKLPKATSMPSMPSRDYTETLITGNQALVREAAESRHRRRESKLLDAEERLKRAMVDSSKFHNHGGRGRKYFAPRPSETDATSYQNWFIKAHNGVALHQTRPSDAPVLRDKTGSLVSAWQP
mmetsp:Transcript_22995/g.52646  ORF Transcript_22995/g.52646 Transcript_22995/m.52646 type:complete len:247 (+) Transcript_22995:74-814(+)